MNPPRLWLHKMDLGPTKKIWKVCSNMTKCMVSLFRCRIMEFVAVAGTDTALAMMFLQQRGWDLEVGI